MESSITTKVSLKQHYFTPYEANIPLNRNNRPSHQASSLLLNYKLLKQKQNTADKYSNEEKELDGFLILESSGMGFPEDVRQISLTDKHLKITIGDDFTYFTDVVFVDVSENFLPLEPFGAFPKLIELKIACNNIHRIQNLFGFNTLMYLDLSYNKINHQSIPYLESIPNLKELDLCGNQLSELSGDFSGFYNLEKLLLEYNKIDDCEIFYSLATFPNIRQISLANNFLSEVPTDLCIDGNFK